MKKVLLSAALIAAGAFFYLNREKTSESEKNNDSEETSNVSSEQKTEQTEEKSVTEQTRELTEEEWDELDFLITKTIDDLYKKNSTSQFYDSEYGINCVFHFMRYKENGVEKYGYVLAYDGKVEYKTGYETAAKSMQALSEAKKKYNLN